MERQPETHAAGGPRRPRSGSRANARRALARPCPGSRPAPPQLLAALAAPGDEDLMRKGLAATLQRREDTASNKPLAPAALVISVPLATEGAGRCETTAPAFSQLQRGYEAGPANGKQEPSRPSFQLSCFLQSCSSSS